MDTIFALATAQGKSGVAVIRVSGSQAWDVGEALCRRLPESHRAALRLVHASSGAILDQALVLAFPEGQSFTGERVLELQLHGSIAVVQAVLKEISNTRLARLAEPGEFTRRALLNDRLDLTQVEGLSDLIEAETEVQRREAMRTFGGELRDLIEEMRAKLVRSAALLEATIDFADEDVPVDVYPEVQQLLTAVLDRIRAEIATTQAAQAVRTGFEVALVGPPNVGKSTLLNTLSGRDAAITSEIAGTTRDIVEVRMDIKGLPVTLLDTAGMRNTDDPIEKLGVARARDRASGADLRVILLELPRAAPTLEPEPDDIVVCSKADLHGEGISAVDGSGIDELLRQISEVLSSRTANLGLVSRERDRLVLEDTHNRLLSVLDCLQNMPSELVAAEIYGAAQGLSSVIGRVGVEDVLDEIFASFCLGK